MAAPSRFRAYALNQARQKFTDGNYGDAFDHYLLAVKLNHGLASEIFDEFLLCVRHWTDWLHGERHGDRLMATFESASSVCSFSDCMMCSLSDQALRLGEVSAARLMMQKALKSFPQSISVQQSWEWVSYAAVERWHYKMLNDGLRNKAYCDAIVHTIQENKVTSVLDIGCGTGLLSLFAGRGGAERVIMCDDSPVMASVCSTVIDTYRQQSLSHFENISDRSTNLSIPSSCLQEKVDLVVTEIFDAALFGEHCLSTLCHAWSELLHNSEEKTGCVIPRTAQLFVCAIECQEIRKENCVHSCNVPLLNMSAVRIMSKTGMTEEEPYTTEDLFTIRNTYRFLSPVLPLMLVDFNDPKAMGKLSSHTDKFKLDIYAAGTVDAMAVWFDLDLCEGVKVSTAPSETCCWEQAIFPVLSDQLNSEEGKIKVNSGDQLEVIWDLNEGCLHLVVDKVVPFGYFLNTCYISKPSPGAAAGYAGGHSASNTETERVPHLQTASRNSTLLSQGETQRLFLKECKFSKISTKDSIGNCEVPSVQNEWIQGQNVPNEEGTHFAQDSNSRQCQHTTLSEQCGTEHSNESNTELLLQQPFSEHVIQQLVATKAGSVVTEDKMDTDFTLSDSLEPEIERNTSGLISAESETVHNGNVVRTAVVAENSVSLTDDLQCRRADIARIHTSNLSTSIEEYKRSWKMFSDGCESCDRHKKDEANSSISDIAISPVSLSSSICDQKIQIIPVNNITDRSRTNKFYLHREEIRHLNDCKYSSLCCTALQCSRTQLKSAGRMVNISSGFPLCGLLALKLGFAVADLCYLGQSDKQEVEDLIERIWQCSGVRGRQWNWWQGSVGEMVEGLGGGVQLDLVWLDVVEMTGSLRPGLADELMALRPVLIQDVVMVPQAVDVYAVLIESPQLLNMSCVTSDDNTLGFSIAPHINLYKTRTFLDLDIHALPHENISEVAHVFHLDIQSCMTCTSSSTATPPDNCKLPTGAYVNKDFETKLNSVFSQSRHLQLTALKSGKATAIVFWFDLTIAPGVNVSTVDPEMNWKQAAFMLDGEMIEEGQKVGIDAHLEKSYLHFSLD